MSKQGYAAQVRVCDEEREWGVYTIAVFFGLVSGLCFIQIGLHYSDRGGWWWLIALAFFGSALCFFFWTLVGVTALFQEVSEEKRLERISQHPPQLRLIA